MATGVRPTGRLKTVLGQRRLRRWLWAGLALLLLLVLAAVLHKVTAWAPPPPGKAPICPARPNCERQILIEAMKARPRDPWPRGAGHVLLGAPGSDATGKAYIEPGGSFSPAPGSFGLSVWVRDAGGKLIATSDSIPLGQLRQSHGMSDPRWPSLSVATPYYELLWSSAPGKAWTLHLVNRDPAHASLELVLRSAGPAGAPLKVLRRQGDRLFAGSGSAGSGWTIDMPAQARLVAMGSEHDKDWTSAQNEVAQVAQADGWSYARLATGAAAADWVIRPASSPPASPAQAAILPAPVALPHIEGGDPQFRASLDAQLASLLISLVGDQTRPGEMVNYPLEWLRDGAYVVVALARAGQVDIARTLAQRFADQDFFGGFGSEADAPGLALWLLAETSAAQPDAAFAQAVWPDTVRKAGWIDRLMHAKTELHAAPLGPIYPGMRGSKELDFVALPARNGLITGRMDGHYPIFFVSATAYAGLEGAARLADTTGKAKEAQAWRAQGVALRQAWQARFAGFLHRNIAQKTLDRIGVRLGRLPGAAAVLPIRWANNEPGDLQNERTAIFGLWPSDIADPAPYREVLAAHWSTLTRPQPHEWSYFTVAEAHQWLRLGEPDRAWQVMRAFWAHQPSPGLYGLSEGIGEVNSFGLWPDIRGWATPPNVTPHYWSAAEMALLQLEMLAYADKDGLMIGAGIPAGWLTRPLKVEAIGTGRGAVSYAWDGHVLHLKRAPSLRALKVRLGPAFPAGTKIVMEDS